MKAITKTNPIRIPRELVKPALLIAAGVILYCWAHECATVQRGYEAIGGEIFLPLLPWLGYLLKG